MSKLSVKLAYKKFQRMVGVGSIANQTALATRNYTILSFFRGSLPSKSIRVGDIATSKRARLNWAKLKKKVLDGSYKTLVQNDCQLKNNSVTYALHGLPALTLIMVQPRISNRINPTLQEPLVAQCSSSQVVELCDTYV